MVGQITPLVQEAGRRVWLSAAVGHVVGSTLSAGVLGLLLGVCSLVVGLNRWELPLNVIGGTLFLVCALRDAGVVRWALPSLERQTPPWCQCTFGPVWGAFVWGVDLGQGWTTHIMFTGYYGLVAWAFLAATPLQSGLIVGAFGLGRALPVLIIGLFAHQADLSRLSLLHARWMSMIQQANALALAFTAGWLIVRGMTM